MMRDLIEALDGHVRAGAGPLVEFKEDLMKQMIILVGSPASGKSYFVKHSFGKWSKGATLGKSFPGVLGLHAASTQESDNSLRRVQYKAAQADYVELAKAKDEDEYNRIISKDDFSYEADDQTRRLKDIVTWELFQGYGSFSSFFGGKGHPVHSYYASMRGRGGERGEGMKEMARKYFYDQSRVAISRSKNVILIDSAGEDITNTPFEKFLKMAKDEGYSPSLVQLYIPLSMSLARNNLRGKKGRAVPAGQVKAAFKAMDTVVSRLRKDDRLDRYVKYIWKSSGPGLFDGQFVVGIDDRAALTRRIKELKAKGKRGQGLAADYDDGMVAKLMAIVEAS